MFDKPTYRNDRIFSIIKKEKKRLGRKMKHLGKNEKILIKVL